MNWTDTDITIPSLRKVKDCNFFRTVPLILRVWLSKDRYHVFQGQVIKWSDGKTSYELFVHETGKSDHKPMIYSRDSFYKVEWSNESEGSDIKEEVKRSIFYGDMTMVSKDHRFIKLTVPSHETEFIHPVLGNVKLIIRRNGHMGAILFHKDDPIFSTNQISNTTSILALEYLTNL